MMRRAQLKNIAQLQQEINAAIAPVKKRHEYYTKAKLLVQKKLVDYFFTEHNEAKILAVMSFIAGYPVHAAVNAHLMSMDFDSVEEFTQTILNSGLGLELEDDFFIFPHHKNLGNETLVFMQQFAHALNAYRACYGMEMIYSVVLYHQHLQMNEYEQYLPQIEALIDDYEAGPAPHEDLDDFLYNYYLKVIAIQKKIALQYNDINTWKESFEQVMQRGVAVICERLTSTGKQLSKATTEFPDNTWFGNGWSSLLIDLIYHLFNGHYNYSWVFTGNLNINTHYFVTLSTELAQYSLKMQEQMEYLKLALLGEATGKVNNLLQAIQSQAAVNQIKLVQPQSRSYSEGNSSLMFYLREIETLSDDNNSEYGYSNGEI